MSKQKDRDEKELNALWKIIREWGSDYQPYSDIYLSCRKGIMKATKIYEKTHKGKTIKNALKPCPVCKNGLFTSLHTYIDFEETVYWVRCMNLECHARVMTKRYKNKAEAVEEWNNKIAGANQ